MPAEGEGEGEGEPSASLRLQSGSLEGDDAIEVTLWWSLSAVSGCELQADGVDTGDDVAGQSSATLVIDESQTLQIVCNEAESEELSFVVHDVSEIEGPAAVTEGAAVTLTFTVEGVTSCAVSTDGDDTALSQPVITGNDGSFTDTADSDKSYTLTCAGSEGPITRSFELDVLTVQLVAGAPDIVTHGDSVELTVAVESDAVCVLMSTAPDGSDRRSEGSASLAFANGQRAFTLANVTSSRAFLVECSIGEATAATVASAPVRIRPRILSFDASIPDIENPQGATAVLELTFDVAGLEEGGACVVQDGTGESPYTGASQFYSGGPEVAAYTLQCSAPGGDAAPNLAGGFQVLWRNVTAADLALIAGSRFAMGNVSISGVTVSSINTGELEQVRGGFYLSMITAEDGAFSFEAPNLTNVGGVFGFGLGGNASPVGALRSVSVPVLRTVGSFSLGATALTQFSAPSLERTAAIGTGITLLGCRDLVSVSLPRLVTARSLSLQGAPLLASVEAPMLSSVGAYLTMAYVPALSAVTMPLLSAIGGSLSFADTGVTSIAFPALNAVGGSLVLTRNARLEVVGADQVTTFGAGETPDQVIIEENPVLRELNLGALVQTDPSGDFTIQHNDVLPCTEIVPLYCDLESRDGSPVVIDNADPVCSGMSSSC